MIFDITKVSCVPIVTHQGNGVVKGTMKVELEGYDPSEVIRGMIKEHGADLILDLTSRLSDTSSIHTITKQ